jgi:hypothetical protein
MKKLLSLFIVAIIALSSVTKMSAQEFDDKSMLISAGIGLGHSYTFYTGVHAWPTFFASFEKGLKEINNVGVISVGGILGFQHSYYDDYGIDYSWNNLYLGGRGAFHFTIIDVDKLDISAGASLGLRFYSELDPDYTYTYDNYGYPHVSYTTKKTTHTSVFYGVFASARYYLSDNIAVFSELGYDISWLKLGASFKF